MSPGMAGALMKEYKAFSYLSDYQGGLAPITEAVTIYRQLPGASKGLAEALTSRFYCLIFLERYEEALGAISEAIDNLRPDGDRLVYALEAQGGCAQRLGRYEEALAAFTEAVLLRRERREKWRPIDPSSKDQAFEYNMKGQSLATLSSTKAGASSSSGGQKRHSRS